MNFEICFSRPLPNGIHARPASTLMDVCEPFLAAIHLENIRNGRKASLRSVLGLISADVTFNDECRILLEGEDAAAAHSHLQAFIVNDFPHCDEALPETEVLEKGSVLPRSLILAEPDYVEGVAVSGGCAKGAPVLLSGFSVSQNLLELKGEGRLKEMARVEGGLDSLELALVKQLSDDKLSEAEKQVLKAHLSIVRDEALLSRVQELAVPLAESSPNLSAAKLIAATVESFIEQLGSSTNPYLQERALDIQDIGARLLRQLYGEDAVAPVAELSEPSVVIAPNLTPSDFIALNRDYLQALVLESGGKTSHTVILARSAGIPVLVGVERATLFAGASDSVVVDAQLGILLRNTNEAVKRYYALEDDKAQRIQARFEPFQHVEAQTSDGQHIEIAANIAIAEEAEAAFGRGAEGVGLFRTEMMFMDRDAAPSEEEQLQAYTKALQSAAGAPVIIRTFDVGGDKPISYFGIDSEENPFLGYRAVRTYPEFIEVFTTQLRALVRAAPQGNLRIMIPMISCVEEMRWVRETLNNVVEQLQEEGLEAGPVQLGMMLEVPSAAFVIDQLARYADFFSIGSNDLTQYFLACDRGNQQLADLYSSYHPAFLRFLKKVVEDARKAERWVGLCGEMASDERTLPLLVGLGLDEISMASPGIARAKALISELNASECKNLLQEVIECEDRNSVSEKLSAFGARGNQMALLDGTLIKTDSLASSRAEVIKVLADNLQVEGRVENSVLAEEALWQREDVFGTGLGYGIAIPHCKSDAIAHNSISVMKLKTPVDWGSSDGQPVGIVFMLTLRDTDAATVHMKIFAQLARKIMHEDFRDSLKACPDGETLLAFLQAELDL